MNKHTPFRIPPGVAVFFLCIVLNGCTQPGHENFVTWESPEPDVWATIWLLNNWIDPQATVVLRPTGAPLGEGVSFGTPTATYRRNATQSTFESMLLAYGVEDERLKKMAAIIHAIEVSRWGGEYRQEARLVESAYRTLQLHYANGVPKACYQSFFAAVYIHLEGDFVANMERALSRSPLLAEQCQGNVGAEVVFAADDVLAVSISDLLDRMRQGQNIVFVDVREASEFKEQHIPGAINLRLRDVRRGVGDAFADADLVVPYCIKDFRGFEVARTLLNQGVSSVATMRPYGFSGWRDLDLPVVRPGELDEQQAKLRLAECVQSIERCKG